MLLGLLLAACSEKQEVWENPGGPCNSPDYCVLGGLRHCSERVWTEVSCDAECAGQGLGSGECRVEFVGARCVCGSCPRTLGCVDAQTIETCVEGEVVAASCEARCAAQGFAATQGCTDTREGGRCWCTQSSACVTSEPRCVSETVLASCESGFQRVTDCSALCPDGLCTLDPDANHHRCACP
jgi:hypothetical protein